MAIISCPHCQQQISDKAVLCQHCDADIAGRTTEVMASQNRVKRIERAQSLQVQTFIALMLFVGGFTLWFWQDTFDEQWYNYLGQGMIAVGFLWYLANRVRLILNKRKK